MITLIEDIIITRFTVYWITWRRRPVRCVQNRRRGGRAVCTPVLTRRVMVMISVFESHQAHPQPPRPQSLASLLKNISVSSSMIYREFCWCDMIYTDVYTACCWIKSVLSGKRIISLTFLAAHGVSRLSCRVGREPIRRPAMWWRHALMSRRPMRSDRRNDLALLMSEAPPCHRYFGTHVHSWGSTKLPAYLLCIYIFSSYI